MNFLDHKKSSVRGKERATTDMLHILVEKLKVIDRVRDILFESKGISTSVIIEININKIEEELRVKRDSIVLELNNMNACIKYCDMHVLVEKIAPLLAKHNLGIFVFFDSLPEGDRFKIRLSGELFADIF